MALRGHRENITASSNPGFFLALLKSYAEVDDVLYAHFYKPRAINATYISPTYQNQIVSVIGHDIVRTNLIAEVKKAIFFSILADEVCSYNVEYLPLSLCFVDERCNICEEFVDFIKLERVQTIDIANAIVSMLEELGFSLDDLRGQGYNGASTMRGEKSGVQTAKSFIHTLCWALL